MPTGSAAPWKWDVSIYDRPGWVARFRGRGRLASPDGERLYVRFEELERASYYGDYFMGRHRDTWVCSPDGGRSWQTAAADQAPNVDGVALPDGGRLAVTHTVSLLRGDALRAYLERAGVGDHPLRSGKHDAGHVRAAGAARTQRRRVVRLTGHRGGRAAGTRRRG